MTTNHTELCERLRTISSCPGWDEAREAAALIESQAARIQQQAARVAELQKALKGLSSMYTFAWDVVDGGLFMNQDGTLRFEDAHKEARRVLGVELMEVDENGELTPEHEERTKLAARIAELEKERDALKADAERWRFSGTMFFRMMSPDMGGNHDWVANGRGVGRGNTLNAAIDARIAALQAEKETRS